MRKSFLLHLDSLCILEELDDVQKGQLFNAIYKYQLGEEIQLSPIVKIAFSQFRNQFLRDDEKYKKVCEVRKQAGSIGGKQKVANQANASKSKQDVANQADNKNKNKSDSDNIKDKDINYHPLYIELSDKEKDLYLEYISLRKKLKLTTTIKIHDRLLNKYFEFGRNTEVIEKAINGNWRDFYSIQSPLPKQQKKRFEDMSLEEKMEYNEQEKQRRIEANYGC